MRDGIEFAADQFTAQPICGQSLACGGAGMFGILDARDIKAPAGGREQHRPAATADFEKLSAAKSGIRGQLVKVRFCGPEFQLGEHRLLRGFPGTKEIILTIDGRQFVVARLRV